MVSFLCFVYSTHVSLYWHWFALDSVDFFLYITWRFSFFHCSVWIWIGILLFYYFGNNAKFEKRSLVHSLFDKIWVIIQAYTITQSTNDSRINCLLSTRFCTMAYISIIATMRRIENCYNVSFSIFFLLAFVSLFVYSFHYAFIIYFSLNILDFLFF